MMRLFELVTPQEWETAKARSHKHADIDQALLFLVEHPEERVRVKAATDLDDEKEGSMKNQCPYRIKDANGMGWWNCQLEAGHESTTPHRPPRTAKAFEGIWHRPGEKSTTDPEPHTPFVGHNAAVGEKK